MPHGEYITQENSKGITEIRNTETQDHGRKGGKENKRKDLPPQSIHSGSTPRQTKPNTTHHIK